MSSLVDMNEVDIEEAFPNAPLSPGPRTHLNSVAALQANLKVVRHFFAKQVVHAEGKTISKRRMIAIYPYGIKFVTEPPADLFEPEHIAELFNDAFLFNFVEIVRFRFDPGNSEFGFVHRSTATATTHLVDTEFTFKTFCVIELKQVILKVVELLQQRALRHAAFKAVPAHLTKHQHAADASSSSTSSPAALMQFAPPALASHAGPSSAKSTPKSK